MIASEEDIENLKISCTILSKTYGFLAKEIKEGISLLQLDALAEKIIRDLGGVPACKNYEGYPATLCTSVNDAVVHSIPDKYVLKNGDILSLDSGVIYNGFFSDSAYSFGIGNISEQDEKLLTVTKKSLMVGIENAIVGKRVGDIGANICEYVLKNGFSVVKCFTGHGLGKDFHEEPNIPNYGRRGGGRPLKKNMVLAIEPMVNVGKSEVFIGEDGWTARTFDGKNSAHFEHTVLVKEEKPEVLTTFEFIEKK
ncbi:MAG: type I methionyl aminopeptidase [Cytophagales bacterium]|jgi:methionyl aminopeptidase|nr:type I methionyl aminopeptidase [Cytophagales bacterium]